MEYAYKIRDNEGRVQRAVAQAESPQVLRARLLAKGIEVIEIKQAEATRLADLVVFRSTMRLFESINLKDLVVFSRQFAAMVTAGVPMLRTLTIVVEQSKNGKMRDTLDDVRRSVEAGLSLSDALARHPFVFDKLYISMVRAGEAGGFLSEVLRPARRLFGGASETESQGDGSDGLPKRSVGNCPGRVLGHVDLYFADFRRAL